MLRQVRLVVVSLALMAVALGAAVQEREVSLRLKFSPKQVRIYEHQVSGESTMTMKPPGQQEVSFTSKFQGKLTQRERVDEVDKDGKAMVTMTVGGTMKLETTGLPGGPEIPPEIEIQPVSVRFRIDPLGKISELILDISELQGRPPAPPPVSMLQMQGTGWQGLLLPEKPVRVGDTWDVNTKIVVKLDDRKVEVEVKGKAKLLAFEKVDERDCAVIEVTVDLPDTGKIIPELAPPEVRENIHAKSEGQATTKFWFDISDGLVAKAETTASVKMDFTFQKPTGESFSMSSKSTFRTEKRLVKFEQEK